MFSINQFLGVGRVDKAPKFRSMQNGGEMAFFNLAVEDAWRDKATGQMKSKTTWISIQSFNEYVVNNIRDNIREGDLVYVNGKVQTSKDKDGNARMGIVINGVTGIKVLSEAPEQQEQESF